jgi:hypothetical protein
MTSPERPEQRAPAQESAALPPADAAGRRPPSSPTKRSRRVREAVFVLSLLAWAGAMYAVRRESLAQLLAAEDAKLKGVFAESFESYLRFRFYVKALGVELVGRAERVTEIPFEGRMIVTHRGKARAKIQGQKVEVGFEWPTRWDVKTGFIMTEVKAKASVPGVLEQKMHFTATREGDFLVFRMDAPGTETPKMKPRPFPKGTEVSSGFMERAPVDEVAVGTKWTEQSVTLSGEMTSHEVEVVESGEFEIAGRHVPAVRAVARIESATGRLREYDRWYDLSGRCLRQEMPLWVLTIVVEREDVPLDVEPQMKTDERS